MVQFCYFRLYFSLRKHPTFREATDHWFPREMMSEKRAENSILLTSYYPDLGSASD